MLKVGRHWPRRVLGALSLASLRLAWFDAPSNTLRVQVSLLAAGALEEMTFKAPHILGLLDFFCMIFFSSGVHFISGEGFKGLFPCTCGDRVSVPHGTGSRSRALAPLRRQF